MTDTVVISGNGTTLEVISPASNVVEVIQPVTQVLEVAAVGPQGPAGLSGSSAIGGFEVVIAGAQNGDLLGFNGTNWYNRRDNDVTDGGNF